MRLFLTIFNIKLNEWPIGSHSKTDIVERKHRIVKFLLEQLQNDVSDKFYTVLLVRAAFLSNLFSGSCTLLPFGLAWGYSPSKHGVGPKIVPSPFVKS